MKTRLNCNRGALRLAGILAIGSLTPAVRAQDPLTLGMALELAAQGHPGLAAAGAGVQAAEARVRQARLIPNPEVEIGISEYDRNGSGFDASELEVALSQRIELGGKRAGRMRLAQAERGLSGWEQESTRLDVLAETKRRFVAVVAAQARVALSEATEQAAGQIAFAVGERVKAGKEPPMQSTKAQAELELARLQRSTEQEMLAAARSRLTAMWGEAPTPFERADDASFGSLMTPPDIADLRARLSATPEWQRWDDEARLGEAAITAADAGRIPDIDVTVGIQRFEEDASDALLFSLALPLPLFDRNQGNRAAADYERERIRHAHQVAILELQAELTDTHARLETAYARAKTLGEKVVPAMENAFVAAQEGYRQGKFDFLDMLDAQRTLFEARASLTDATETYHHARIDIERLTGEVELGANDALAQPPSAPIKN